MHAGVTKLRAKCQTCSNGMISKIARRVNLKGEEQGLDDSKMKIRRIKASYATRMRTGMADLETCRGWPSSQFMQIYKAGKTWQWLCMQSHCDVSLAWLEGTIWPSLLPAFPDGNHNDCQRWSRMEPARTWYYRWFRCRCMKLSFSGLGACIPCWTPRVGLQKCSTHIFGQ